MTTKRLLIIIFSILGGLALLVALFVGAIAGVVFYSLNKSEAASSARAFLKQNEKLREDIGDVRDFGSIVTGTINTQDSDGTATLYLEVEGARKTVDATVHMVFTQGGKWRVTGASYVNEAGQTVYLLDRNNVSPP